MDKKTKKYILIAMASASVILAALNLGFLGCNTYDCGKQIGANMKEWSKQDVKFANVFER